MLNQTVKYPKIKFILFCSFTIISSVLIPRMVATNDLSLKIGAFIIGFGFSHSYIKNKMEKE